MDDSCRKLINQGIKIRRTLTIIVIIILIKYYFNTNIILPILLYLLDISDNILYYKNNMCVDTFYYKINDKINDLLSYLLIYLFFPLNKIFLIFLIYRAIGVLLFAITRKSIWFTKMTDLYK
jgi:hypothetical protein